MEVIEQQLYTDIVIVTADKLTEDKLYQLARARAKKWLQTKHSLTEAQVLELCYREIMARVRAWPEGQLVALDKAGTPGGAIHPLRVNSAGPPFTDPIFANRAVLTGNGTYSTHVPDGNTLVCPEVYSTLKGAGRQLVKTARDMGLSLKGEGKIQWLIAYTRPTSIRLFYDFEEDRPRESEYLSAIEMGSEHIRDDPIRMHYWLDGKPTARFVRFVRDASPEDSVCQGWGAIMQYF